MIFYAFSKFQPIYFTIEVSTFHRGPWNFLIPYRSTLGSQKSSWNFSQACNVALGHDRQRLRPNSGEVLAGEGRGRVEDGKGLTTGRFVRWFGTEEHLAVVLRGAVRYQSRERLLRRGGGTTATKGGRWASVGARGGVEWLGGRGGGHRTGSRGGGHGGPREGVRPPDAAGGPGRQGQARRRHGTRGRATSWHGARRGSKMFHSTPVRTQKSPK
jgi:hypothetical protein